MMSVEHLARAIVCPFCFQRFAADAIPFRCKRPTCRQEVDTVYAQAQGTTPIPMGHVIAPQKKRALLSRLSVPTSTRCDLCGGETRTRICPACHFELSHDAGLIDQRIIAIIGGRATGKTHYIATLGAQLKGVVGRNFHFAFMEMGDHTQRRWNDEFYTPLFGQQQLIGRRTVLPATQSGEVNAVVKAPLIFRLMFESHGHRRALNLSFFDTAGEDMGSLDRMSVQARYITEADGIIFLIDPLQAKPIRSRPLNITLPTEDTRARPDNIAIALRQLFEREKGLKPTTRIKTPVAFALSKSDTLLSLPEVDPGSKLRTNGAHHGSVNWADMQAVNTEVENYIREWLGSNFVEIVHQGFEDYAFFTVSALGAQPTSDGRLAREVDPLRVEDPFLWLLAKLDLIPVTKGR